MRNSNKASTSNGEKRFPRLLLIIAPIMAAVILAALWRFTPLRDITSPEKLQAFIRARWTYQWWTVFLVIGVYLIASLLMFPNSLLNMAVILGFGGFIGWLYAISGSLSAATVFFFAGKRLGAEKLHASSYKGIQKIRKFLVKGGIFAVVAVRAVPSAPYGVMNSVIGTFDSHYPDFIVGTFIAHLPGTVCLALFSMQLKNLLDNPSPQNIGIILLIVGAAVVLLLTLRRKLKARIGDESNVDNSEPRP